MKTSRRFVLTLAAVVSLPMMAVACLWDYDTLAQERGRFPSTLELITGKFLRHSPEFYEWRIEDRLKKLEKDPNNLNYHDDLAVAYSKIGNFDKAIEVIQRKEKIQPGLYETYSNLGTFYILAGRFKEGLPYIDKALAINPDAHFGREKYQKYLVEYVLEKMANKNQLTFPLGSLGTKSNEKDSKFRPWLLTPKPADYNSISREDAIKGVLGMMRFADYKNPILLEALGDLLWIQTFERWPENIPHDGKLLAARAYLQASYQMKDDVQREEYRKIATAALYLKSERSVESIEPQFLEEIADAEKWYEELRLKEIGWIKAGLDVEAEFDKLYDREPQVKGDFWELLTKDISQDDFLLASIICFFFFVLLFFLFCIVAYRRVRRWRSRRNSLPG